MWCSEKENGGREAEPSGMSFQCHHFDKFKLRFALKIFM